MHNKTYLSNTKFHILVANFFGFICYELNLVSNKPYTLHNIVGNSDTKKNSMFTYLLINFSYYSLSNLQKVIYFHIYSCNDT